MITLDLVCFVTFYISHAGTQVAIRDETSIPGVMTIRHSSCPLLLPHDSRAVRCSKCSTYRSVLKLQCWKAEHSCTNDAGTITHVNNRYLFTTA